MKTLNQQINAVMRDAQSYAAQMDFNKSMRYRYKDKKREQHRSDCLKDACSTLIAVRLIGVKRIALLPELIEASKGVMREFDSELDSHTAFRKLRKLLEKMK